MDGAPSDVQTKSRVTVVSIIVNGMGEREEKRNRSKEHPFAMNERHAKTRLINPHTITQPPLFFFTCRAGGCTMRGKCQVIPSRKLHMKRHAQTARMASSKTVFNPFWVKAEHSRYFTAPMSFCICTPIGYEIGDMRLQKGAERLNSGQGCGIWGTHRSRNFSMVVWSSRRSSLVPTRTNDVEGA